MTATDDEHPATRKRTITGALWPAWVTWIRGWPWSLIFQGVAAFIIPLTVVGLIFSVYQFKAQQKATADQLLNQQRQAIMDNYLNDISSLVLNYRLSGPSPDAAVKALAVARTDTAVRNLDGVRKGILIRYLWDAGLIRGRSPVVYLHRANLNEAFFRDAYLYGADLSTDYLFRANLSDADAHGANLSWADLVRADLDKTNLGCITTSQFEVTVEMLKRAHPESIDCANLKHANLSDANLQDADLVGANLTHVILDGADLKGARYNSRQILIKGARGNTLTIPKTQWPPNFNPGAAKAHCIDCSSARPGR